MGKVTGFLEIDRQDRKYKPAADRIRHYHEFVIPLSEEATRDQAARCMNCGIPFCHNGCPVNNQIPDWNDLVYRGRLGRGVAQPALHQQLSGIHRPRVPGALRGGLHAEPGKYSRSRSRRSNAPSSTAPGKTAGCAPSRRRRSPASMSAVVGSGPAGMAAAQQLARAGHEVHLYERNAKAGGLLRYGIPDFKMEKSLIDRRVAQMEAEGVVFHYGVNVGVDIPAKDLVAGHDAVILTGGSEKPRDLPVPGRELSGVHFAMDFLPQQNRRVSRENAGPEEPILAAGKHVVVIGGGDTGSDCIGTSVRQGALSVMQLEIMPKPPEMEDKLTTWPYWPLKLRTSSSHQEGADRDFAVMTKEIIGDNGAVKAVRCVRVDTKMQEIPGSEFELRADLVLLAMGFVSPVHEGMLQELGVTLDSRGNVLADTEAYRTSVDKIFVAGDMRRGQSLVVWAIREGRQAARAVDVFLTGSSDLPR